MELLLTSDNKDDLSKGVVDGGTCVEAGAAPGLAVRAPLAASAAGRAAPMPPPPVCVALGPEALGLGAGVRVRDRLAVTSSVVGLSCLLCT